MVPCVWVAWVFWVGSFAEERFSLMKPIVRKTGSAAALAWATAGCVTTALMFWIMLSDDALAGLLWPADIHALVVGAMGGKLEATADGRLAVSLQLVAVLVRTVLAFLTLIIWGRIGGWICMRLARARPAFVAAAGVRQDSSTTMATCDDDLNRLVSQVSWQQAVRSTGLAGLFSLLWLVLWLMAELMPGTVAAELLYLAPGLWLAVFLACLVIAGTTSAGIDRAGIDRAGIDRAGIDGAESDRAESDRAESVSAKFEAAELRRWRWIPQNRWSCCLMIVACVWIAVSFWMNERLYAGLWIPHGDSAMYEEHLWNVWHGKGFRSYLDQGLFLGEHIQVIHLLLLPIHVLWPSVLMMELAESVALGICVVPIYSMAVRYSGSRAAGMWLGLTWLLFFPMHFLDIAIDLKTLRPGCYGLPFLFWGIDLAERRRLWGATICLLVALSAQEDFALIIGPVGFVLWLTSGERSRWLPPDWDAKSERRFQWWSLGVALFCVVYVLAVVLVVIPWFRSGVPVHYSRYFGDLGSSPGDLVRTTLREPFKVLAQFFQLRTLLYVLVFAAPMGFLMLRSPVRLIAGAATFVMLSLIQLGNANVVPDSVTAGVDVVATVTQSADAGAVQLPPVPYHHFHAPLLPVLFWAAAAGLRRRGSEPVGSDRFVHPWLTRFMKAGRVKAIRSVRPVVLARFAFVCAAFSAVTGSMMPCGVGFWSSQSRTGYSRLFVPGARAEQFAKLAPLLPLTARIASTDYVHARLTHCERSYDYSDYLRAVNNYRPGVPADTDLIVIDTQHPYSAIKSVDQVRELLVEPDQWKVWEDLTDGYFIVLERLR